MRESEKITRMLSSETVGRILDKWKTTEPYTDGMKVLSLYTLFLWLNEFDVRVGWYMTSWTKQIHMVPILPATFLICGARYASMKALVCLPDPRFGGPQKNSMDVAKKLLNEGIKTEFLIPQGEGKFSTILKKMASMSINRILAGYTHSEMY